MTTLLFNATEFSTWALGAPTELSFRWDALRFALDQDVSVPVLGVPGATVTLDGTLSGYAGLFAELQLGLGAASVSYGVAVDAPSDELFLNAPVAFDTSGFSVLGGSMQTEGPDPAGGSFRLGLDWELAAALTGVRLDIPLEWAGVSDPSAVIEGIGFSTGPRTQDLFRINGSDLDPLHLSLIPGLLGGTLQLPSRVDTATATLVGDDDLPDLVSEGASTVPFAEIELDIDGAISQLLTSLGVPIQLEGDLTIDTGLFRLELGYTILQAAALLGLKFGQRFTFDASHVDVRLETEFGDAVNGRLGEDFDIPTPDGGWGTMEVQATYSLAGTFRNQSGLVASALIEHAWFAGNAELTVFGQTPEGDPQSNGGGFDFGPLFRGSFPSDEGWDFASFYLYDDAFAVDAVFAPLTETYVVNWENFWEGTPEADILTLTPHQVEIDALGGDDRITGNTLDNAITLGGGDDTATGGGGDDSLSGGEGADTLEGGPGNDTLDGGTGSDRALFVGDGDVIVLLDSHGDGSASDGQGGLDALVSIEEIETGGGNDLILLSGPGTNRVASGDGDDVVATGDGRDEVWAGGGADTVALEAGDDWAAGEDGADSLDGGVGRDTLAGGEGADTLAGGTGDDWLAGQQGDDVAFGGEGADTLNGGEGADTLDGGEGDDLLSFASLSTGVVVNLSLETVAGAGGSILDPGTARDGNGAVDLISGFETVLGSAHDDMLLSGTTEELQGDFGADTLVGGTGAHRMLGGVGNDTYIVRRADQIVVETGPAEDHDHVISHVDFSLQATPAVEDLTLVGAARLGTGNASANRLTGTDGADTLEGAGGRDTFVGGAGDDVHVADFGDDLFVEAEDAGRDTLRLIGGSAAPGTFDGMLNGAGQIEDFILLATGARNVLGNTQDNLITDNASNNRLEGREGNDTLSTTAGLDTLHGGTGSDRLVVDYANASGGVFLGSGNGNFATDTVNGGYAGRVFDNNSRNASFSGIESFSLATGRGADNLRTGDGADSITSGAGNDTINSGTGADTVDGGGGNDYLRATVEGGEAGRTLDLDSDAWQELGSLRIRDIEGINLRWLGDGARGITTSASVAFNDVIATFGGDDTFRGGLGLDDWAAGQGDDLLILDYGGAAFGVFLGSGNGPLAADTLDGGYAGRVFESNTRHTSFSGVDRFHLATGNGADNLRTGDGADSITSGAGNDTVNAGGGNDHVDLGSGGGSAAGGEGFDTLVVTLFTETQALVLDAAAGQVRRGGSAYVSFSGFERFDIAGGLGADSLVGGAEADTLRGGGGADTLDGGGGRNLLIGGDGDDLYLVGELRDRVQEAAGGGHDWIRAGITMAMPDFVEVLDLVGPLALRGYGNASDNLMLGNAFDNVLRGADGADTLAGGDGADVLDGGAGADSMAGGAGADAYIVDHAGDVVLEADEPGVSDAVRAFVSFVLPDFVERLRLAGTEAIDGTGNALANTIGGNDAANLLVGGAGDDILSGEDGADTLSGGAGSDRMRGGEGADLFLLDMAPGDGRETILDFEAGIDRLGFVAAAFPDLGLPGQLDAALFHAGSSAGTAAHRILYDARTRLLSYDADGAGGADAVTIALVRSTGSISAADLWVV